MACFEVAATLQTQVFFSNVDYLIENHHHLNGKFVSQKYSNGSGSKREPRWTENEAIILVCEYFRIRYLDKSVEIESISKISKILRAKAITEGKEIDDRFRNPKGVELQFKNLVYIDPKNKKAGLSNVSTLLKETFNNYINDSELMLSKENVIITDLLLNMMELSHFEKEIHL